MSKTEEFIKKSHEIHGNKYDYSKVEYINSKTKVCIICPKHGEFWQIADNHINGKCNCPLCVNNNIKLTTQEFISKSRKKHGDKYDYSQVNYINNRTPVIIFCPIHGKTLQRPEVHLKGTGCSQCSYVKRGQDRKLELSTFLQRVLKIHENKYDYTQVKYETVNDKIDIYCPEHGSFKQTVISHLNGHGCPECGKIKGKNKRRKINDIIDKCVKVHNNKYIYHNISSEVDLYTKISIICPEHGEFLQRLSDHERGHGCPKCGRERTIQSLKNSQYIFIEKAKQVHGNKYDYSKVEYINTKEKVCIICPEHGEFWQIPNSHIRGAGCRKCANEKNANNKRSNIEEFIKKVIDVHGNRYDYTKSKYINNHTKIGIICLKHGLFYQTPNDHLNGAGCPKCNKSKLELYVSSIFENNNIQYQEQVNSKLFKWLGRLSLDFYLPKYNIAIECQGKQHFGQGGWFNGHFCGTEDFKKSMERDLLKKDLCKLNGVKLLYFADDNVNVPSDWKYYNVIRTEKELLNEINKN